MTEGTERTAAVLLKALSVCRGLLYSARTGDATTGEIERILDSTGEDALIRLLGNDAYRTAVAASEALSAEDVDALLAIGDTPYDG